MGILIQSHWSVLSSAPTPAKFASPAFIARLLTAALSSAESPFPFWASLLPCFYFVHPLAELVRQQHECHYRRPRKRHPHACLFFFVRAENKGKDCPKCGSPQVKMQAGVVFFHDQRCYKGDSEDQGQQTVSLSEIAYRCGPQAVDVADFAFVKPWQKRADDHEGRVHHDNQIDHHLLRRWICEKSLRFPRGRGPSGAATFAGEAFSVVDMEPSSGGLPSPFAVVSLIREA